MEVQRFSFSIKVIGYMDETGFMSAQYQARDIKNVQKYASEQFALNAVTYRIEFRILRKTEPTM